MNIFGGGASARPVLPKVKAWDELTRLQHEFSALGFYLSAHPLDNYRALLKRMNVVAFTEIGAKQRAGGPSRFKIAGIVLGRQEKTAKSGNRFAFVSASDTTGAFEVTVFSELLNARRDILEPGEALLMEVDAQGTGADLRFIGRNFERLSDVAARSAQGINIRLYEPDDVAAIKKRLDASTPGRGKVTLTLDLDDDVADVELPGGWQLSDQLKQDLRQIGNGLDVQEC
jgi:DNA polymerase-3 subunit alpha